MGIDPQPNFLTVLLVRPSLTFSINPFCDQRSTFSAPPSRRTPPFSSRLGLRDEIRELIAHRRQLQADSFLSQIPLSRVPFLRIQFSLEEQQGKKNQKTDQNINNRTPPPGRGGYGSRRGGRRGLGGLIADRFRRGGRNGPRRSFRQFHQHSSLDDLIFPRPFEEEAGFLSGLSRFHQAAGDLDRGYRRAGH